MRKHEKEKCPCCSSKLRDLEFVSPEKEREFMEKYGEEWKSGKPMIIPPGYFRYVEKKGRRS